MCWGLDGPEINVLLIVQLGRHIIVYIEEKRGHWVSLSFLSTESIVVTHWYGWPRAGVTSHQPGSNKTLEHTQPERTSAFIHMLSKSARCDMRDALISPLFV